MIQQKQFWRLFNVDNVTINLIKNNSLYSAHPIKLPYSTVYDDSWSLEFCCGTCNQSILFERQQANIDVRIDCLFYPYYVYNLLSDIASLFNNMKMFRTLEDSNQYFLTHKQYVDSISSSLYVPKVSLFQTRCKACFTQIILWLNDNSPLPPSKDFNKGFSGLITIYDIIGVQAVNNEDIQALIKSNKLIGR